ncbi:phosphotransferase enzyme family [Fusarium agapanthi]|uniref:Phosphotransferase enzyme family n=1 Tax=Fusarium agapanthi TaxID=1803897 RepID=A0A9P5BHY6_9HYPO|nr:phosphotransferase enzyme family [Fusarium agapanthi]
MVSEPTKLPYFRHPEELPGPLPALSEIHDAPDSQLSPRRSGWTDPGGVCLIRNTFIVKYGTDVTEYKGNVLLFVERYLNIRAPRLYAMYRDESTDCVYLIMEYIQGVSLETIWPSLSDALKASITSQLKQIFDEMGSLKPPENFIGGIDGGSLRDPAFQTESPNSRINGPFKSPEEVGVALALASEEYWEDNGKSIWLPRFFSRHLGAALKDHEVKFTHGDLYMRNILVEKTSKANGTLNGDGLKTEQYRVKGIVDWEAAGWYPAYWEYATAMSRAQAQSEWPNHIGNIIKPFPLEFSMILLVLQNLQLIF